MPRRNRSPGPPAGGGGDDSRAELRARLEAIFKEHHSGLLSAALKTGRPLERSKELIQEAFVRVYMKRDAHKVRDLLAYVYATLRNLCRSDRRAELAQMRGGGARMEPLDPESPHARSTDDVEADLLERERKELLREAMAELPPICRRCAHLTVQGLSQAEIARRLGIERGTVKAHVHRARKKLKEIVAAGDRHERI